MTEITARLSTAHADRYKIERPRIDLASAARAWIDFTSTDLFVEEPSARIASGSIRARNQLSVAALSSSSPKP